MSSHDDYSTKSHKNILLLTLSKGTTQWPQWIESIQNRAPDDETNKVMSGELTLEDYPLCDTTGTQWQNWTDKEYSKMAVLLEMFEQSTAQKAECAKAYIALDRRVAFVDRNRALRERIVEACEPRLQLSFL